MAVILIIDDSPAIGSVLKETLEIGGYEVLVAGNGRDGLALHRARRADVVITDIFMPVQDGIETILELRRTDPDVKVVAMSGAGVFADLTYLPAAKQLGAVHSLSKPFDCEAILSTVRQLLAS